MKNEWQRIESSVLPTEEHQNKKTGSFSENEAAAGPEGEAETSLPRRSNLRYTPGGRRRGVHPFAAPIGMLIMALAAFGLISLVAAGLKAIERAQDDTALREELYDFLLPVMQYIPEPFTSVNETKQDALLLAAIWRVTEAERIRQLKDSSSIGSYLIDDIGRMLIPVTEIEDSYMFLYGSGVTIQHRTIGEEGKSFSIEYNKDQGCYHVPTAPSSMYVPVIDTIKKKGSIYTVRVGYVLYTKIGRDDKGELVDPTPDLAEKFQLYTVEKTGSDSWKLVSVANEKSSQTSASTTETGFDEDFVEEKLLERSPATTALTTKAK